MILFVTQTVSWKIAQCIQTGLRRLDDVICCSVALAAEQQIANAKAVVTLGWKPLAEYVRVHETALRFGIPHIAISDGYLQRSADSIPRYSSGYWAVSLNGLNIYTKAPFEEMPSDRWDRLNIALQPWKHDGKEIVVAHQHGLDWKGGNRKEEFDLIMHAAKNTGKRLLVRYHPNYWGAVPKGLKEYCFSSSQARRHKNPIENDLTDAYCLVSVDSNAAINAIINGIPSFLMRECLPLAKVGTDFVNRFFPERQPWFNWLTYQQWTAEEIGSGTPFRRTINVS